MFWDDEFVESGKMILLGLALLLLVYRWVHYMRFRKNHPKDFLRFRFITPYPQRDVYATGSANKRVFMISSNRLLYILLVAAGISAMLELIPALA